MDRNSPQPRSPGRRGSQPELLRAPEELLEEGIVGEFGPRTVARDANEKLIAVVPKSVVPSDAEKRDRRVRVPELERASVVQVPEPNVLRKSIEREQPVLGVGELAMINGQHGTRVCHRLGDPARTGPACVGRVRRNEADWRLAGSP